MGGLFESKQAKLGEPDVYDGLRRTIASLLAVNLRFTTEMGLVCVSYLGEESRAEPNAFIIRVFVENVGGKVKATFGAARLNAIPVLSLCMRADEPTALLMIRSKQSAFQYVNVTRDSTDLARLSKQIAEELDLLLKQYKR